MGVEYYFCCFDCKCFIDLHKAYAFDGILRSERPNFTYGRDGSSLHGNYWETRGLWFLWNHRKHEIELINDAMDDCFNITKTLKEIYSYNEDLALREKAEANK